MKDSKIVLNIAAVVLFGITLVAMLFYFKPATKVDNSSDVTITASVDNGSNGERVASEFPSEQRIKPADNAQAVQAIVARRAFYRLDPQQVQAALGKTAMWEFADPQKAIQALPWLTEKQKTDGRSFIQYDPYVLESKFVGDQIDVFLPELGLTAKAVIDDIRPVDDNIIRWQGHFVDFNDSQSGFSISQTLKDQYAVGTFKTPLGNFSMESKNGMGWVVNQEKDFFLPENGKDTVQPDAGTGGHAH